MSSRCLSACWYGTLSSIVVCCHIESKYALSIKQCLIIKFCAMLTKWQCYISKEGLTLCIKLIGHLILSVWTIKNALLQLGRRGRGLHFSDTRRTWFIIKPFRFPLSVATYGATIYALALAKWPLTHLFLSVTRAVNWLVLLSSSPFQCRKGWESPIP